MRISTRLWCSGVLLTSLLASCTRNEEATKTVAPEPPERGENAAPLNNIEVPDQESRVRAAAERGESAWVNLGEHNAEAMFRPLGATKVQGKAELREIGDQVQIDVDVERLSKGKHALLLREVGPCTGLPMKEADTGRKIGEVEVSGEHEAETSLRVDHANLKPREPGSLLGKALVLADTGHSKGAPDGLACAQIRAD